MRILRDFHYPLISCSYLIRTYRCLSQVCRQIQSIREKNKIVKKEQRYRFVLKIFLLLIQDKNLTYIFCPNLFFFFYRLRLN